MAFIANFIDFQQCKNFENRLRFDKVRDSLKVGRFFETQCIYARFTTNNTLDCAISGRVLIVLLHCYFYNWKHISPVWFKLMVMEMDSLRKTDVTTAILSRDFVTQLYCATKSQAWHGVSHNFSTVAQTPFPNRAVHCSVQLCRAHAVNADW